MNAFSPIICNAYVRIYHCTSNWLLLMKTQQFQLGTAKLNTNNNNIAPKNLLLHLNLQLMHSQSLRAFHAKAITPNSNLTIKHGKYSFYFNFFEASIIFKHLFTLHIISNQKIPWTLMHIILLNFRKRVEIVDYLICIN